MWSETIKGRDMVEYLYAAEIARLCRKCVVTGKRGGRPKATTRKEVKEIDEDWNRFANTIAQKEFPKLAKINGGYAYRVPPAGAIIDRRAVKSKRIVTR